VTLCMWQSGSGLRAGRGATDYVLCRWLAPGARLVLFFPSFAFELVLVSQRSALSSAL
jgi:hypothetical protein